MARAVERPTISDVARHAGVAKSTVSFVLNGRPGVRAATRERILTAADKLGWTPSAAARGLSQARSFAVALVLRRPPELLATDPFFGQFVAGVETVLATAGYALVLQIIPDDEDAELDQYRKLAASRRADGVFLLDLRVRDRRLDLLEGLDLPAVVVGTPAGPCAYPRVVIHDHRGIRDAVIHLVELGHERIAHVAGAPGFVHTVNRQRAWQETLEEAGLEPGPVEVGDFSGASGAAATQRLLGAPSPPTAIVYANDLMAMAGLGVASKCGLAVPADLSIVGFDDVPLAAWTHPPLTTICQDAMTWGRSAAEMLLAQLRGDAVAPVQTLSPPRLVVRDSTARPPRP